MIEKVEDYTEETLQASKAVPEYSVDGLEHRPSRQPPPTPHSQVNRHVDQAKSSPSRDEGTGSLRALRDLEKGLSHHQPTNPLGRRSPCASIACSDDDSEYDENNDPKRHAVWVLIYLSALAPLIALLISLYTIVAAILVVIVIPLLLLFNQGSLKAHFYRFLAPPLRFQLGLTWSTHEMSPVALKNRSSITLLLAVNILAPIYAMAIALAAWVGGAFWFYTAILGNPDGKEERDDGREAVFAVNRWWERWLIQGLGYK